MDAINELRKTRFNISEGYSIPYFDVIVAFAGMWFISDIIRDEYNISRIGLLLLTIPIGIIVHEFITNNWGMERTDLNKLILETTLIDERYVSIKLLILGMTALGIKLVYDSIQKMDS